MHRLLLVVALVSMLALAITGSALAHDGHTPVGGCPDGFMLHDSYDMPGMTMDGHHHVGVDTDHNGDGFICMKHVGHDGNNHVHTDNNASCVPDPARCMPMPMG